MQAPPHRGLSCHIGIPHHRYHCGRDVRFAPYGKDGPSAQFGRNDGDGIIILYRPFRGVWVIPELHPFRGLCPILPKCLLPPDMSLSSGYVLFLPNVRFLWKRPLLPGFEGYLPGKNSQTKTQQLRSIYARTGLNPARTCELKPTYRDNAQEAISERIKPWPGYYAAV